MQWKRLRATLNLVIESIALQNCVHTCQAPVSNNVAAAAIASNAAARLLNMLGTFCRNNAHSHLQNATYHIRSALLLPLLTLLSLNVVFRTCVEFTACVWFTPLNARSTHE